ncbi:hypothetical protein Acr_11g0008640 [Actinidia rufa]|uniref:Uncharacterized protein n=1 Tax=Actinidia rufa TaxID=165716 RepID=A0A7J0FD41_9ERIC|nr:hypothetical protein Acr_11g0008640 [Actinidia rufa]
MRKRNWNWAQNRNHMGWGNFFELQNSGVGLGYVAAGWLDWAAQALAAQAGWLAGLGCWLDWATQAWAAQAGWLWTGPHRLEWGRTAGAVLHTTQALAWLHGAEAGLRGQEQGLRVVGLRGCWTDWAAWLLSGLHTAQGCTGLCLAARCRGRAAGGGCRGVAEEKKEKKKTCTEAGGY